MREIRPSGLEGGGAAIRSPYPYRTRKREILRSGPAHPPNCRRGSSLSMASRLGQRTSFMV